MSSKVITTDRQVAGLKPRASRYESAIPAVKGMLVRTYPTGEKLFELRYTNLSGVRRRHVLGEYPALSLADATNQAEAVRLAARRGEDPAGVLQAKRHQARTGDTVSELATAYFEAASKGLHGGRNRPKRPSTLAVERSRFARQIAPALGERRFADISRGDCKAFMRSLATAENLSADYVSSIGRTLSSVFAFAVHEERIEMNPMARLTRPRALVPRERMFDRNAVAAIWRALSMKPLDRRVRPPARLAPERAGHAPVEPTVSSALRFAILTLTRRKDVSEAPWAEIDLRAKLWTIPSNRHKSGRTHVVPLTDTAIELLLDAARRQNPSATAECLPAGFIFSSRTRPGSHVSGDSLTRAMKRLCIELGVSHGSPHDWRRTAATGLTGEEAAIRRFVVSKVLSHAAHEGAVVTERYDRNDYLAEKRKALEAWERLLLEIAGVRVRPENVTQLPAPRSA